MNPAAVDDDSRLLLEDEVKLFVLRLFCLEKEVNIVISHVPIGL